MLGTSLQHYQITSKLGQGGMGEVYRATDTKLDREVAIKVLPAEVAGDQERLARFEREAKVLAQLNHENVATVHGFDHHEGTSFLVMEHVEGEDLSERLRRGPLPVEEAIEIGQQIAEALEAAHGKGIVHRDLKPANIKVTAEGQVKVLDFGLAKALGEDLDKVGRASSRAGAAVGGGSPGGSPYREGGLTRDESATLTLTDAFTKPGTVLGTAAYMSPEQAKGKGLDQRTDVWSFGCVLFECLTGERAFAGGDAAETLASILKGEPDWSLLPNDVSLFLQRLVVKCLTKDPHSRLQHIGDARVELTELASGSDIQTSKAELSAMGGSSQKPGIGFGWLFVAMAAVAMIAAAIAWTIKPSLPQPERPIRKVSLDLGVDGELYYSSDSIRLSRDGKAMGFLFTEPGSRGGSKLFVRYLDRLKPIEVQGVQDVRDFSFSPNGEWIALLSFQSKKIHKVSLKGEQSVVTLSGELDGIGGIDWTDDGWILFVTNRGRQLRRVPEEGGPSELVFEVTNEGDRIKLPRSLPGGQAWLVTLTNQTETGSVKQALLQRGANTPPVVLIEGAAAVRFAPPGFIVFVRNEMLFAQRFNVTTLTLEGKAIRLDVTMDPQSFFDISHDGTMAFTQPGGEFGRVVISWLNRRGNREKILPDESGVKGFSLSADGFKLAYVEEGDLSEATGNLWSYDTVNGGKRLLSSAAGKKNNLLWVHDDSQLVFAMAKDGVSKIYAVRADGSGELKPVLEGPNHLVPYSWYAPDRKLLYGEIQPGESRNIQLWVATFSENEPNEWALLGKDFYADSSPRESGGASFSPDGKWIVYSSQEAQVGHLFMSQYPEPKTLTKITFEGIDSYGPHFLPEQNELVFLRRETKGSRLHHVYLMKYRENDDGYQFDRPQRWENGLVHRGDFSVHPQGQELVVRQYGSRLDHVVLFENMIAAAERKLSAQEE